MKLRTSRRISWLLPASVILSLILSLVLRSWVLLCIGIGLLIGENYWLGLRRRKSLQVLRKRPDGDVKREVSIVCTRGGISREEVERLWFALARFYGVLPEKIRATDSLRKELIDVIGHPDHDACFSALILGSSTSLKEELNRAADWADFLIALNRMEKEAGRLLTKEAVREGQIQYDWTG